MRINVPKVLGMYHVHKKHPKINDAKIIFQCYIQTKSHESPQTRGAGGRGQKDKDWVVSINH